MVTAATSARCLPCVSATRLRTTGWEYSTTLPNAQRTTIVGHEGTRAPLTRRILHPWHLPRRRPHCPRQPCQRTFRVSTSTAKSGPSPPQGRVVLRIPRRRQPRTQGPQPSGTNASARPRLSALDRLCLDSQHTEVTAFKPRRLRRTKRARHYDSPTLNHAREDVVRERALADDLARGLRTTRVDIVGEQERNQVPGRPFANERLTRHASAHLNLREHTTPAPRQANTRSAQRPPPDAA